MEAAEHLHTDCIACMAAGKNSSAQENFSTLIRILLFRSSTATTLAARTSRYTEDYTFYFPAHLLFNHIFHIPLCLRSFIFNSVLKNVIFLTKSGCDNLTGQFLKSQ